MCFQIFGAIFGGDQSLHIALMLRDLCLNRTHGIIWVLGIKHNLAMCRTSAKLLYYLFSLLKFLFSDKLLDFYFYDS